MEKVDAIVPCYNEAKRIGNVLSVLTKSKWINQVIVVDDGSSDGSSELVSLYFPTVNLITLIKNGGKGNAVRTGLEAVETQGVFMCDADLTGLTEKHIHDLVAEYSKDHSSLVVGMRDKIYMPINWLTANVLPLIAGERIISTATLKQILAKTITNDYGIEVYMNYYFRINRQAIKKVRMAGVNDIPKYKKETYGITPFVNEAINISQKYLQVYTHELSRDLRVKMSNMVATTMPKMSQIQLPKVPRVNVPKMPVPRMPTPWK